MYNLDYLIECLKKEREEYKDLTIPNEENKKILFYKTLRLFRKPNSINDEYLAKESEFLKEYNKDNFFDINELEFKGNLAMYVGSGAFLNTDYTVNIINDEVVCCMEKHLCNSKELHLNEGVKLNIDLNNYIGDKIALIGDVITIDSVNIAPKKILNVVYPSVFDKFLEIHEQMLRECVRNIFGKVNDRESISICFPCFIDYNIPLKECYKIYLEEIKKHKNIKVVLVFDTKEMKDFILN